jgi:nucleoside 2-deoxyribosyltransferase
MAQDRHRLMRVYLAGPDVFLPNPHARAAALKTICSRHGLTGISPLDDLNDEPPAWTDLHEPFRIARRNEAHIASCAALIANLTPFRGPSADAGTVFELGFMRALNRPVYGWTNVATAFATRTRSLLGVEGETDADGLLIEDFTPLADNLMIDAAIAASGGILIRHPSCPPTERWTSLDAFDMCLAELARKSGISRHQPTEDTTDD